MDISHKILYTHATLHRHKLNKKKGTRKMFESLRRGNKIVMKGKWREGTGWKRGE